MAATLCAAQAINISRTVKDHAGVGIGGAIVSLEKEGSSTTTAANGTFTLTSGATAIQSAGNARSTAAAPVRFQNGLSALLPVGVVN